MKIMVAYDGTPRAQAALADLAHAGLPQKAEIKVVTVIEPLHTAGPSDLAWGSGVAEALDLMTWQARKIARQGKQLLQRTFPGWQLDIDVYRGQRAAELVAHAAAWEPELLVISPLNRNKWERLLWGSLSRNVVENAPCSVRVARQTAEDESASLRILVGYDGSRSAEAALDEVSLRQWPPDAEVRLVAAVPPHSTRTAAEEDALRKLLAAAGRFLHDAGLRVSFCVRTGPPRQALLEEATVWGAHCLFVGRNQRNDFNRWFSTSTSAALAVQAPCTVEVVREGQLRKQAKAAQFRPLQPVHKTRPAAVAGTH
ncbi:MAG: universal stress protein [Blastocatellia bacterium]|nr:universal stress protein [Blastocatellia bacterium]